MNRKGFTLVELLAVIVILASISLVTVASISSSLMKREDKELDEQQRLAINAAKIYFSLNKNKTCVKLSTLKGGDYFNDVNKTNRLGENSIVTVGRRNCDEKPSESCYYYTYHETNTVGCQ